MEENMARDDCQAIVVTKVRFSVHLGRLAFNFEFAWFVAGVNTFDN